MRRFLLALVAVTLMSPCLSADTGDLPAGDGRTKRIEAVYLTAGKGALAAEDLAAHPEVLIVDNFAALKSNAASRGAFCARTVMPGWSIHQDDPRDESV